MTQFFRKPPAPVARPDLTVSELADLYLKAIAGRVADSTVKYHGRCLARFCHKHGDRPARSIIRLDAERHRRRLLTEAACNRGGRPARVSEANQSIAAMRACWNWALAEQVLPFGVNPFRLRRLTQRPQTAASAGSFSAVLRHCPEAAFRRLMLAVRYTGASQHDLRRLSPGQVDWRQSRCCLSSPDGKGCRHVYFGPLVSRLLRWCIDHGPAGTSTVFLNSHGRHWADCTLSQRLLAARRRGGAGPDSDSEGMSFRSLRHTFARTAMAVGVNPAVVRQLLGRRRAAADQAVPPEVLAEVAARVEAVLLSGQAGA